MQKVGPPTAAPLLPGLAETPEERTKRLLESAERDFTRSYTEKPKWRKKREHARENR